MKSRILILAGLAVASLVVFCGSAAGQSMIEISSKQYVLPVSELATTKTYPDILRITTDGIEAQVLPNRGRLLSSLRFSSMKESMLYQSLVPDPFILSSGLHAVDFGGYYLSIPWNVRDRQPYDLSYKIEEDTSDRTRVSLSGTDILKKVSAVSTVTVLRDRALVDIRSTIRNDTSTKNFRDADFREIVFLSALEGVDKRSRLLLPSESVTVIDSKEDWVGSQGSTTAWTSALSQWSTLKGRYDVRAQSTSNLPCFAIHYPGQRVALVKLWSPADYFDSIEVMTRGPGYEQETGYGPYFMVSCHRANLEIAPKAETGFRSTFVVLQDVDEGMTLGEMFERAKMLLEALPQD
ncbi:MAG: hypothetical protein ABSG17_03205 [Spirochaetia bacterium]|jgi:hypothetical protein